MILARSLAMGGPFWTNSRRLHYVTAPELRQLHMTNEYPNANGEIIVTRPPLPWLLQNGKTYLPDSEFKAGHPTLLAYWVLQVTLHLASLAT